jgi:Reverse transcriptase (RNA-dependent DNA polymerase)
MDGNAPAVQPVLPPMIPPIPNDPAGAFMHVLQHIIGLDTPAKRDRVTINAGITEAEGLLYVEMDSLINSLTPQTSIIAKTRLKTLKRWVEEEYDIEGAIDISKFTDHVCRDLQRSIARSTKPTQQADKGATAKEKLPSFNGKRENWLKSKRELTAYLNQIKNEQGVPLYYVIRDPDQEEKYRADNGDIGKRIYEAPFKGRIYESDSFQVIQILRQWTSGGQAETYVDNNNDVQDAWDKLVSNYEGHDAKSSNIQKAREMINTSHWTRNSQNFTFDDYCNRHIKANNELDRYKSNVDGESQVNAFLKGIRTDHRQNPQLLSIKAIVLTNPDTRSNLSSAIITFKDTMRQIAGTLNHEREHRYVGAIQRNGGRYGGRGSGGRVSGRHHDTRRYGRGGGRGFHTNRGGRGGGRYVPGRGGQRDQSQNLFIPDEIIQAVGPRYQAMLFRGRDQMEKESQQSSGNPNAAPPRNASSVGQATQVSEATALDHHHEDDEDGNASSQFGATGRSKKRRTLGAIKSTQRRIGRSLTIATPTDYHRRARAEIDTRADTLCAGSTFLLHETTGKVVDVTGFHESLDTIKNIQVGTCITAIDLPNETIIASFPQSLYFGDTMEHSLIPPAQLWNNGITVDVVPKQYSDGMSLHGIHHPDHDLFIPFHMHGCISYFGTRLPTADDLQSSRWITFTSEAEWNPYSSDFTEAEQAMVHHSRYHDPRHLHFNADGAPMDGRSFGAVYMHHSTPTVDNHDVPVDPSLCTFDYTYNLTATRHIHATSSKEHRSGVPPEILARRWGTSVTTAAATLAKTTQRGLRYLQGPLSRRFRTRQKQLQNRFLNTRMYTDTLFKEKTSARGNTCVQLFVTAEGFVAGQPIKGKGDAFEVLEYMCREYGIPRLLVSDNAKEETLGNWGRIIKQNLIKQRTTEPYSSWQNRCEGEIREVRKHYTRIMALHQCPDAFWDFAMEYVIKLRQFIVRKAANDRPPLETVTGETPDTSEYMDFDFYSWVKYRDAHESKDSPIHLGRWLGVAHEVGTALTYWILKSNGQIICRSTVRPLLPDEISNEGEQALRVIFNQHITAKFGDFDHNLINLYDNDDMEDPIFPDLPVNEASAPPGENLNGTGVGDTPNVNTGDINIIQNNDQVRGPDLFQDAEIILPHGDRNEIAKVIGRKRNQDGNYIGRAHKNPKLDSRIFTVRFADGEEKDVSFNILAEHLYSQVDSEGNQYRLFREIINHRRNKNAVDKADQFRITTDGKRVHKKSVVGWDMEIEWRDGTTSWLPLKEVKETNAVEVARYAKDNNIIDEPAFVWWAPHVLKKMTRLIKLSKSRHIRRGYKFGIKVPNTVEEALQLDKENDNTLWYDALMKETPNVRVAFEEQVDGKAPPGYKKVGLMMIFDIKMDFTRKARLVARGDLTDTPSTLTYSSVVSRESVRIAFLVAALNDLDIMMFDVGNAYLNAQTTEKLYCYAGKEFGIEDEGKMMIIRRALYGLKSSGAAYRAHFATTLSELGFKSCQADPDVWMRASSKVNGFQYYEYLLTYVDDCLIVSHAPKEIINTLEQEYKYRLKDVGEPKRYLGAEIGKYHFSDGTTAWYMSAKLYLQQAIIELERKWGNVMKLFPRQTLDVPMQPGSHPEMDTTKFLSDDDTQLYQSYIGILRWAVELGRVDLAHVAGAMARFSASPREGHLYEVLRIFAYCKKHIESKAVFDPQAKIFDNVNWLHHDWKQFYPDIVGEILPPGQPKGRGNPVQINLFCDAAHATCHVTRRSTTGIIIFINGAPISWYSKRQNTIESSTFGSEFVALKIAIEMNDALRYKLRMMGINIQGATNCFCDNKSVVTNSTIPQSTLTKKHNSIAYHKVRESVASDAVRIAHERGTNNLSDVLTKFLPSPSFRKNIQCILMR